jgi:hypothetical protein
MTKSGRPLSLSSVIGRGFAQPDRRLAGKPNIKRRSGFSRGIKPNFSSVRFNARLSNGKPEAGPTLLLGGNERVKDTAANDLGYTRPVIGNRDQ